MYQDSYLLRSVTNTNIVIGNREQSSGSMTIILGSEGPQEEPLPPDGGGQWGEEGLQHLVALIKDVLGLEGCRLVSSCRSSVLYNPFL